MRRQRDNRSGGKFPLHDRRIHSRERTEKNKNDEKVIMAEIIDDTRSFSINLEAKAGLGEIVNMNYPATVQHGAEFDIDAAVTNVGEGTGTFVMEWYIDGSLQSRSGEFELAAEATSADKIPAAIAPTSGAAMSIVIKCIRIT